MMRLGVAVWLLLALCTSAHAYPAKVVRIIDGDTLVVLAGGHKQVKVRLAAIDAPEKRQAFGERSRQALARLCFQKSAEVTPANQDRYGRTVARVSCEGEDASKAQVHAGMAWVYRQYSKDGALIELEAQARSGRRGLWTEAEPVPPWEYRRIRR